MKPVILILICIGTFFNLPAQQMRANTQQNQKKKAEIQVASFLTLAENNRPNPGDTSEKFIMAIYNLNQAISLSSRMQLHSELHKASMLKLDILLNAGKIKQMEQMLLPATDSLKAEITRNISRYYNDGHFEPRNFQKAIEYGLRSLDLSILLKDSYRQINANNQLGFVYMLEYRYDESEKHFLQVINAGKEINSENIGYAYVYMIMLSDRKGYYNRGIQYGLDALRYLERRGYDQYSMNIYYEIGRMYMSLNDYNNSLVYIERAMKEADRKSVISSYWYYVTGKVNVLLQLHKPTEARDFIEEAIKSHPPASYLYPSLMRGKVNIVLKEFTSAKKNLLEAERLSQNPIVSFTIYKTLAELHFATGNYDSSKNYLDRIFMSRNAWTVPLIAATHLLAYQVDSSRGAFQSAMLHLQKNKQLTDSLNALSRMRQAEELKLQYQTEKITQDVTLKQQTILLLENQQQLQSKEFEESRLKLLLDNKEQENHVLSLSKESAEKDKNILLNKQSITQLETDNAKRKASLADANFIRNITIGFVLLLLLIVVLLYRQFTAKQKATKIIGTKNAALQNLVQEKEQLLEEKDWLLKEVHHRVKNNLQTVVSLLESQSIYLDNKALEANQDSRNRVYAMSLVHQKLYQSENVASIQMDIYLGELVEHLRDSMDVKGIYFKLNLIPVKLDVSQAISLGLILNEAITNSIKHAFPGSQTERVIEISLMHDKDGWLRLNTKDNGIGLPADISTIKPSSLGLKLMKGLTGDIMGDYSISSDNGTMVSVHFLPEDTLPELNKKVG